MTTRKLIETTTELCTGFDNLNVAALRQGDKDEWQRAITLIYQLRSDIALGHPEEPRSKVTTQPKDYAEPESFVEQLGSCKIMFNRTLGLYRLYSSPAVKVLAQHSHLPYLRTVAYTYAD